MNTKTVLEDIIQSAVDSTKPLPDLLRKCKVLAMRLQNPDLLNWVNSELEGYQSRDSVPEYRKLHVGSYGIFYGPFGSSIRNLGIPLSVIPKEHRDYYRTANIIQSVSALNDLVINNGNGQLQIPWPADFVAYMQDKIIEDMVCRSAWQQISKSDVVAILDVVRSRILNFTLELEKIDPNIGTSRNDNVSITTAQVSQIFNTYILGNVGHFSSVDQSQNLQIHIEAGNVQSLKDYLLSNKVSSDDIKELIPLLDEMRSSKNSEWSKSLGDWFINMMGKVASGVWGVSMSVASNVLTTAISRYLGL